MTSLIRGFKAHAGDDDGLFMTEITFQCGRNQHGHEWGMTINGYKRAFLRHAERLCYDMGIVIGVNEIPNGFELGFEHEDDYAPFMQKLEAKMAESARVHNSNPLVAQVVGRELVKVGIWKPEYLEEGIRKMMTPASTNDPDPS